MGNSATDRVFIGRIERSVDSSGRFRIPAAWFAVTGQGRRVYVMPDSKERCLRLIPVCNMELRLAKIREWAEKDPARTQALQALGEMTELVDVDAEGCVGISTKLLEFAGITNQLVMVGGEWYTQLWNPNKLIQKEYK